LGGDGDPLDVLVLSGHTIPVGCVVCPYCFI
jgi:inorganic pyrophosphatase